MTTEDHATFSPQSLQLHFCISVFCLGFSEAFKNNFWSSHCGTVEMNPTRNYKVVGSIHGLAQWVKDPALL